MFVIVGLGNIGKEYENTRHNFGFILIDYLINKFQINNHTTKFNADIFTGDILDEKVIIVKPTTFMNRSGIAVSQIKTFYKIPIENIIVFHDDIDLEFCKVKVKIGGGDGGHNGIKSLDSMIGKNYTRVRLGTGRPINKIDVCDFVLSKFNIDELKNINMLADKISTNITELFKEDKNLFLTKLALA